MIKHWDKEKRGPQMGNAKHGPTIWKYNFEPGQTEMTITIPWNIQVVRVGSFEGVNSVWIAHNIDDSFNHKTKFRIRPVPFLENFEIKMFSDESILGVDHSEGFTHLFTMDSYIEVPGVDRNETYRKFRACKTGAPLGFPLESLEWNFVGGYYPYIQQELGLYLFVSGF